MLVRIAPRKSFQGYSMGAVCHPPRTHKGITAESRTGHFRNIEPRIYLAIIGTTYI
jgi:hypothetical protein